LSRGGTCKTNLRGINATAPTDYIDSSRTFTSSYIQSVDTSSVENAGVWSATIKKAYEASSTENDPLLQYPSLLSTSTTGTLLFRLYIKTLPEGATVQEGQCVFLNGDTDASGGGSGYGVFVTTDASGIDYNLFFTLFGTDKEIKEPTSLQINSSLLALDTWYSYGVQFETVDDPDKGSSTFLTVYENGNLTLANNPLAPMVTPSGGTYLFSYTPLGAPFYGGLTDFALLDAPAGIAGLSLPEYGSAPYI
jgi:hypothetical protein